MDNSNEISRITAVRGAVVGTTNTPGWTYIKQFAEKITAQAVQEALDEDDATKRDGKVIKAAAMQKAYSRLFNAVEQVVAFDSTVYANDDNGLGEFEEQQIGDVN